MATIRHVEDAVLTTRALNRALLARQLLLDRVELSIPDALQRLGGIQNQYAPNAYLRASGRACADSAASS